MYGSINAVDGNRRGTVVMWHLRALYGGIKCDIGLEMQRCLTIVVWE